jgi:hypothetical protein
LHGTSNPPLRTQIFDTEFLAIGLNSLEGLVDVLPALPRDQLPGKQAPKYVALYKTLKYFGGGLLNPLQVRHYPGYCVCLRV